MSDRNCGHTTGLGWGDGGIIIIIMTAKEGRYFWGWHGSRLVVLRLCEWGARREVWAAMHDRTGQCQWKTKPCGRAFWLIQMESPANMGWLRGWVFSLSLSLSFSLCNSQAPKDPLTKSDSVIVHSGGLTNFAKTVRCLQSCATIHLEGCSPFKTVALRLFNQRDRPMFKRC